MPEQYPIYWQDKDDAGNQTKHIEWIWAEDKNAAETFAQLYKDWDVNGRPPMLATDKQIKAFERQQEKQAQENTQLRMFA